MFDDILLFVTLVEVGNFSQAAVRLNLTQATISRRLKELERKLEVKLVRRNTRNFEVTPAGKKLYEGFCNQRSYFQQVIDGLKDTNTQMSGKLRVSLPPGIAYHAIAPYLAEFLQENPGIRLDACFQNREIDLVTEHFDLAVISHMPKQQTTKVKLLHTETIRMYCSPLYIQRYGIPDILDIENNHLYTGFLRVDLTIAKSLRVIHKNGEEFVIPNNSRLNSNNAQLSREMAINGHAIALAWDNLFAEELANGTMLNPLPDYTFHELPFYLIRLANNESAIIKLFITFLERCFKRLQEAEKNYPPLNIN